MDPERLIELEDDTEDGTPEKIKELKEKMSRNDERLKIISGRAKRKEASKGCS